jgi:hypothetical protein
MQSKSDSASRFVLPSFGPLRDVFIKASMPNRERFILADGTANLLVACPYSLDEKAFRIKYSRFRD